MAINYNDSRLTQVEKDKQTALTNLEKTYGGLIDESDKYYQSQIDASKQWAETQSKLQQEQTDFALQQIEQQKAQAQKDYTKEQSAAYVDWKKQSNQYGAQAEQMAASGLQKTGYSESSQVDMYNTYQNRVATTKQSFDQIIMNYNNSMTTARLQNNAALAEISAQALQEQLEISLQGFQYKNSLILQKEETRQAYENIYYSRYLDVINQINTEKALAEQMRQFNANLAEEKRQYDESLAEQRRQFWVSIIEESRKNALLYGNGTGLLTDDTDEDNSVSSSKKNSSPGTGGYYYGGYGGGMRLA